MQPCKHLELLPVAPYNEATMIYLGSDHAGFELKQGVKKILDELKETYTDLGNEALDPADDYPDYAFAVGEAVAKEPGAFGILSCGSGEGVCIAANKVKGVRAVEAMSHDIAVKVREHNDANVLCLSGWKQTADEVRPTIATFIGTPFSEEERHVRRLKKIGEYESR